ncbi:MAG: putative sugar nucleotidyl transferase, partial [Nitrososphaerota archaeon]|nr:putative sugar nucleotidyl transferase [Nitrososphaerota archaeon]
MKVIVFEDDATYNFEPLTLTRGAFDLRIGLFSFADRIKHYMQVEQLDFMTREHIAEYMKRKKKV